VIYSVADPGCLSRIPIFTHPGSRIPKQQQKRGVKKIVVILFFWSHKFHKIENYFSFDILKIKIWANFQRIIKLFTPIIVTKLEIREKPIPNPVSRGSKRHWIPDPGSGFATLVT
jgi:hypothetical protein